MYLPTYIHGWSTSHARVVSLPLISTHAMYTNQIPCKACPGLQSLWVQGSANYTWNFVFLHLLFAMGYWASSLLHEHRDMRHASVTSARLLVICVKSLFLANQ